MENKNVYVGHRYVPKIMGEHDKTQSYEGLSIVTHEGTSYTSKKHVPIGVDINNEEYWVVTGNYNAQIEEYRKEVKEQNDRLNTHINDNKAFKENTDFYLSSSLSENIGQWSIWEEFERRGVNVDWYGAKGDGITDDTNAFINANKLNKVIYLSKGKHYKIQNFVPLKDTTIISNGATISRFDNSYYENTDTSSALVVTNDNINIIGGTWTENNNNDLWSGSIVIESGSLNITNALIEKSWGGVFGHKKQNESKIADYVSINNCKIRYCVHNTYLADIKNLLFTNNHSYKSDRDGLRTYRNVHNIIVTNNHIHSNGDGTIGQSQDAIDLFIAGNKCIIKNNYLYNCEAVGIDIKHATDGQNESVKDNEFIIEGNFIYGHKGSGISISSNTETFIENISITNNRIYENGSYGIRSNYGDILTVTGNQIYNNGREGLRIENTIKGGIVSNNIIYDNTNNDESSVRIGMFIVNTALNIDVFNNKVFSTGKKQQIGISYYSNGICKDNNVTGHSTNISGGTNINISGLTKSVTIPSGDLSVPILIEKECSLSNIITTFSGTGNFTVVISKRGINGKFKNNIHTLEVEINEAYVMKELDISQTSQSDRLFKKGEHILIDITTNTGGFVRANTLFNFIC